MRSFETTDGFVFYFVYGQWVDNLDPNLIDITSDGNESGPIDTNGEPIPGQLNFDFESDFMNAMELENASACPSCGTYPCSE